MAARNCQRAQRHLEPLRAVSRERADGRVSLRREQDADHGRDEGGEQDDVRERQVIRREPREQPRGKRAQREPADGGDRGDRLCPARHRAVRARVEIGDVGGGRRHRGAERQAGEDAPDHEAGKRLPGDEDDCRRRGEGQRRQEDDPAAAPVGHMAGEQQAGGDPRGVDGVDERDRDRRRRRRRA
jgi:hypothetical protein